jgi:hypothetical protein
MPASVVQFKARAGSQTEDLAAPLAEDLRRGFEEHAQALLERFFEVADDRLFDYGGRSGSEDQAAYLQALRSLRGQRQAVREGYAHAIAEQLQRSRPQLVAGSEDDKGLRLIEDHIVEERLALETTRQRIENDCGQALYEFRQRLEGARRQLGLPLIEGQFSPGALCAALHKGLRPVVGRFDLLLVLLKIFEQVARVQLAGVYEQLNALLEASGIAFEGARDEAQGNPAAAAPAPAANDAAPTVQPQATAAIATIRALAANVAALAELLGQSSGAPSQRSFEEQLQLALSSAQQPEAPAWTQAVALRAAAGAWLFDELLGDVQVAASLRDELGGLRSPLVRASLQDEAFLSNAAHPLRQLVQDVSALAVSAKLGRREEVSGIRSMIHELGTRLQQATRPRDLQATSGVDEVTLQGFAQAVRDAAQLRRDRLVQRARDRAVEAIDHGVQRHLAAAELPECVALALEKVFGPLLGLILLRCGPAAAAFRQALELLDEFLATLARDPAERPAPLDFVARLAQAAAKMGFSAARQAELRLMVEAALRSDPQQAGAADEEHPAAAFTWDNTSGLEVAEVSEAELQTCAGDLFTPGSWFCVRSPEVSAEPHWMQVERYDTEQGQVLFRGLLGAAPLARPLQRLLFEILCGECQHISSSLRSTLALAKLARAFGMAAA